MNPLRQIDQNVLGTAMVALLALASVITVFVAPWQYACIISCALPVLAAFFVRPEWGVYALIVLIPFTTASVYFYIKADWNFIIAKKGIDLIPVFAVVVLFTWGGYVLRRLSRVDTVVGNFIAVPVFLILLYAGLTVFGSDSFEHSLFQFMIFVMNVGIFFLVTAYIKDEAHLVIGVWCFVVSGMLQASLYIICFFFEPYTLIHKIMPGFFFIIQIVGGYFQSSGMPQVDGGFMDHHELALLSNLLLPILVGLYLTRMDALTKKILIGFMLMFVLVVLKTQSRAGIGSLMVMGSLAPLAFQATRKYFIRFFFMFVVAVLSIYIVENIAIGVITKKYVTPRLWVLGAKMVAEKNVIDPGLKEKTGRMRLWKKAFKKYKAYFVEGFGVGNLKKYCDAPHAHSVFLSFLFDFGVMGVAVITFIVGAILMRFKFLLGYQTSYTQIMSIAFGVGLVAIGVHGQVDFEYNTSLLWLYLGLTVSSFRIAYEGIVENDSRLPGTRENTIQCVHG
jgi:hypothetical protein